MIYIIIIVLYFVLMLGIGFYVRRKARDADGFFVAGRKGSTFFITGSLVATIVGASATVGMAGLGYSRGLTGAWWMLAGSIGLIFLGILFAGKVRNMALYTLPELAEKQYDKRVGIVVSILIIISWIGIIAGQIVATGKIFGVIGIGNPTIWMILFTIIFIIYTLMGGQHADISTNVIQSIIIIAGIIAGLALMLPSVGGIDGMMRTLPPDRFAFPLSPGFEIMDLVSYLLIIGLVYVVGPDMYSRIFCARDAKSARNAVLWTALILVPLAFCITLIGMEASVLFPQLSPEQAFPSILVNNILPPIVGGLVLAALVSATMSSAYVCLISTSTILTIDIIKKWRPSISERQTLAIARWAVTGVGLLSLLLALVVKGIISALLFAYTVYTCGVILPVLAGFYRKRLKVTPVGAIAAIIGGGTLGVISKLVQINYLDIGALLLSGVLLFAVSFIDNRMRQCKA